MRLRKVKTKALAKQNTRPDSPSELCSTPGYCSSLYPTLSLEGLEGVDDTKPSKRGWLQVEAVACRGQGNGKVERGG